MAAIQKPKPPGMWDSMLPGPPSRSNFGCCDCSPAGLLAYGAGSSVVVVDPRTMQLVSVLPMPSLSSSQHSSGSSAAVAPYVTSVRWSPQPIPRDVVAAEDEVAANPHLRIAVGDRQGRVAVWDFRSKQVASWLEFDHHSKLGIQDLCWLKSDSWVLASISGPSLLSLWDVSTGRCFWKYDCSPELFSCIRRDPFDSRHFSIIGLRGFLLSAKVLGIGEDNVAISEQHIPVSAEVLAEIQKLEKESPSSTAPASAAYPNFFTRFCFSPRWRHVIHVTFPKEVVAFDLQYGTSLSSAVLPRGYGKFMDVAANMDDDLLYCTHLDSKLSTWKRKEGEQVYTLYTVEELIPALGTSVPSPVVLATVLCLSDSTIQNIAKLCSSLSSTDTIFSLSHPEPSMSHFNSDSISNTNLISISDDGKIWNWALICEKERVYSKRGPYLKESSTGEVLLQSQTESTNDSIPGYDSNLTIETGPYSPELDDMSSSGFTELKISFKISLVGQLHLLSSTVTTLAVPSPSLTATLARGGNNAAAAVPVVALGTQNGCIDIIDISANAVAESFSVHDSIVRGLRWLGNSRLVSFSYSQVADKRGGYTNKLVVTCVRSGLNRAFRVMQKTERAPIRAIRASSSGRYLLIMFRDAPVEVWAMTKNPVMLRSLALPFTVLEWTLPAAPRPTPRGSSRQFSSSLTEQSSASPTGNAPNVDSKTMGAETSTDDMSESFAFALVNGALGVFEINGRRIRDFRPKWPSSSFVSSDGLITAMAYRLPHVVLGDRSGYIRWWDVTSGLSSSFNTYKEGIRRIKFSPVVAGDRSRGRIAVLFYDNSFSIFDLDKQDPLANALLQPQSTGTLVVELDWLPTRTSKDEPLVLCIAGADGSFRLIEVNINETMSKSDSKSKVLKERFRPMPLCLPILLPTAHALALRMILQFGVKPSWFSVATDTEKFLEKIPESYQASPGDLRNYMIESNLPAVGDSVVPELFLKVLETYKREGYALDGEKAGIYSVVVNKGCAARLAFAAAIFGEFSEAFFWLQLPNALRHSLDKAAKKLFIGEKVNSSDVTNTSKSTEVTAIENFALRKNHDKNIGKNNWMTFEQGELWGHANERISWHENLDGEDAIQKRVHELVSVGNLEAAVTLLLSTPPEGPNFYPNALRAVALSAAVSRSLHELAVKVIAANMVRTDKSVSGIHLLCAVGRYQEACSQLQDAGFWTDAATLAATHLDGSDYARVLLRWAGHVLHNEHNLWRALILYVAAGAMREALAALRESKQPDTAAMFILACHEIYGNITSRSKTRSETSNPEVERQILELPHMDQDMDDITTVTEYFGQYQRKLVHLCMDAATVLD